MFATTGVALYRFTLVPSKGLDVGLPDIPYFKGCPVFGGTCSRVPYESQTGCDLTCISGAP